VEWFDFDDVNLILGIPKSSFQHKEKN